MTRSYPDTLRAAASRIHARILAAADNLPVEAPPLLEEGDEQRIYREAAERGARAYAELLQEIIDDGAVTNAHLEQAELVATAAECAGWIGVNGAVTGRETAMRLLIAGGYFALYDAVPGRYMACYRLVG